MASELEALTAGARPFSECDDSVAERARFDLAQAPPLPTAAHCSACGETRRIALGFSMVTHRWWVICEVPGCRACAPA